MDPKSALGGPQPISRTGGTVNHTKKTQQHLVTQLGNCVEQKRERNKHQTTFLRVETWQRCVLKYFDFGRDYLFK